MPLVKQNDIAPQNILQIELILKRAAYVIPHRYLVETIDRGDSPLPISPLTQQSADRFEEGLHH